eukprot:2149699-Rhodomonas_salina.1
MTAQYKFPPKSVSAIEQMTDQDLASQDPEGGLLQAPSISVRKIDQGPSLGPGLTGKRAGDLMGPIVPGDPAQRPKERLAEANCWRNFRNRRDEARLQASFQQQLKK